MPNKVLDDWKKNYEEKLEKENWPTLHKVGRLSLTSSPFHPREV